MKGHKLIVLVLVVLHQMCPAVYALNILVIVSLPLRSHYMAFHRLFQELAARGHSLTVINNYPQGNSHRNLTFVDISVKSPLQMPPMSEFENIDSRFVHISNFYRHLIISPESGKKDCENLFINENMKRFRERNENFDVIFVEQFMSDCGLMYAAAMYEAPIIGITSHTLLPWAYPRLGIPFHVGADAFYFSPAGVNPSLYEKVENYIMNNIILNVGRWFIQRNMYKVFNQYLPNSNIDIEEVGRRRMKMMFVYQHQSITGARLMTNQLLDIGGVHIDSPKPVPKDIEEFLSDAERGAIYVSFGSNLKANTMSAHKLRQFLEAFKRLPQKVVWKLEDMEMAAGYDNVYVSSWLPQLDLLCHPKVLGFVSHGGMLSLSEAAHCGKPLLTIPFFGDQFSNVAAAAESGIGVRMHFQQLNADTLVEAIANLTSDRMQKNAKRVSKLWHDRPVNVLESAIYWTEYVARHRNIPSSLPSLRTSWFEHLLIDVYSVLIVVSLVISFIVYVIFKVIVGLLCMLLSKGKPKKD